MDILNIFGTVLFTSAATILKDAVSEAVSQLANLSSANLSSADLRSADLRGANLSSANLSSADLSSAYLHGADLRGANLRGAYLRGANLSSANLRSANLSSAYLHGADLHGADLYGAEGESKKADSVRVFSSSLYPYIVMAVLFEDGERMIKMGCLEKTVSEWRIVGIRKSNEIEFPDNGSEISEDRIGMFNLAKTTVTRMKLTSKSKVKP